MRTARVAAVIASSLLALLLALSPAFADKRVALVIGNAAYRAIPALINPKNDAEDVAKSLRDLGFEVIVATDLDRAGMNDVLDRFSRITTGADIAVVYYSGHGMQFGGANFLLPIDARLASTDDVNRFRLVPVEDVLETLRPVRGARVLVLDACRNNPVEEDFKRRLAAAPGANRDALLTRGLGRISAGNGLVIAYATQANDVASDGVTRNSPFTAAFLKHAPTPDIDLRQMFSNVQDDVDRATAGKQRPELSISLVGQFKLKVATAPLSSGANPPVVQQPAGDPAAQAWAVTKDTNSVAVLEDFIRHFGSTVYGSMARARLEELKKSQTAVVAPPSPPAAPPTIVQPAVGVFDQTRKASPLSAAEERALKAKNNFKECDACPEMVVVPAGSFTMGSPASEPERSSREEPQHQVNFARQFAVGKFAVTFAEWDACVADGGCNGHRPSDQGWGREKRPVINVSWDDAKTYLAWLSRKTGKTYQLLSETEREYVTRAGTTTPFWWGSSISPQQANYDGNYAYNNGAKGEYRKQTLPVDSFQPNPWGLYQVHGNVWEWTEDCWIDNYNGAPTDGSARTGGSCSSRVLRGGSWSNGPRFLRSADRNNNTTTNRSGIIGLRVARTLLAP